MAIFQSCVISRNFLYSIFISPFHSASSEDSAENHDEREVAVASAASMASNEEDGPEEAMNLVVAKSPVVDGEAIDEEEAEALEVTKLLSGGIMETQFGDLMMATSGRTPTPPMEDTGKLLFKKKVVMVSDNLVIFFGK